MCKEIGNSRLKADIIVIGASTGGLTAVGEIISKLPRSLTVPVVIIQHIPNEFVESYALRLQKVTPNKVEVVRNGQPLLLQTIYIMPAIKNVQLKRMNNIVIFQFTSKVVEGYNYPSINMVMMSAATVFKARVVSVILTGMGADGAQGCKEVYDMGGYTIAQNEESCVVYGMPKKAVELGGITHELSLRSIPIYIIKYLDQ